MRCPRCNSEEVVKNGSIPKGKKKFMCKDCGRQFIENPANKPISEERKKLIDSLLLEKLSLAGIARVGGVSEQWLQDYVNKKDEALPRAVKVTSKKKTFNNAM